MLTRVISRSVSVWSGVPMGPPDPILGISEAFNRDTDPRKVNLGVGAYRDDQNKPLVLPSVRAAEELLFNKKVFHEYSPVQGIDNFRSLASKLAYGPTNDVIQRNRVASVQSLSGTGALRIGMEFLNRFYETSKTVYLPTPTWGNHKNVAKDSRLQFKEYTYYDNSLKGININGLLADLDGAPEGSIILLHACAHNPTGADPTLEQWRQIKEVVQRRRHLAFFDMAYQGFASGSVERDNAALRDFVDSGVPVMLCQSFAKNFGLYGERVGLFSIVTEDAQEADRLLSQLKILARPMYSNPPLYGARIVETVLGNPELEQQWYRDVKAMADRIIDMRQQLVNNLKKEGSTKNWQHIIDQIGMFAYTGLSKQQSETLTRDHHVYLTLDGRISLAGLNSGNVAYVAKAIHQVTAQ